MEFSLKEIIGGAIAGCLFLLAWLFTITLNSRKEVTEQFKSHKEETKKLLDEHRSLVEREHKSFALRLDSHQDLIEQQNTIIHSNKQEASKTIIKEREFYQEQLEKRDKTIQELALHLRKDLSEVLQSVQGSTEKTRERIDSLYNALIQLREVGA